MEFEFRKKLSIELQMNSDITLGIIGGVCVFLSFAVPIPQIIKSYNKKDSNSLSKHMVILQCLANLACITYSAIAHDWVFVMINAYNFLICIYFGKLILLTKI